MGIYVGDTEIKGIYLGDTPVKEVYLGDTKVRPKNVKLDYLIVGGGGGGGKYTNSYAGVTSCHGGGGGGGGGFVEKFGCTINPGTYNIIVGVGGGLNCNGGFSCVFCCCAYGGGRGGYLGYNTAFYLDGANGGSGGGGGGGDCGTCYGKGGCAISGQGCPGGNGCSYGCSRYVNTAGGGGGASSRGADGKITYNGVYSYYGGNGGLGKKSTITGEYYGNGGGGGATCCYNYSSCITIPGIGYCGAGSAKSGCCDATGHGNGGGGGIRGVEGGCGSSGIVAIRYPTVCNYDITGGTKYTCGDYTIHCFTSNGTLTIN